jgi:hypothetical protein
MLSTRPFGEECGARLIFAARYAVTNHYRFDTPSRRNLRYEGIVSTKGEFVWIRATAARCHIIYISRFAF